ncbi:MAG: DUF2339 domain-containing protein [Acidimicrobiia bacterium]|nr:DUF2339 domain-containing protein [Acidimicrobiia bacterium]
MDLEHELKELRVRVAVLENEVLSLKGSPAAPPLRRPSATQPPLPAPPPVPRPAASAPKQGTEAIERFKKALSVQTSETILKWAGIGLVLLAVAFAVGLAIERGWITPTMRIIAAGAVSIALFVVGQRIRSTRALFAETLQGASFVAGFFTAFGSIPMGVVSGEVGFAAMVVVALAALVASYMLNSPPIAVLGLLGGASTPFLIERFPEDPEFLASFAALIAISTLIVFVATGWRTLLVSTAAVTWGMLALAADESDSAPVVISIAIVGVALWLVPLGREILEERGTLVKAPMHHLEESLEPLLKGVIHRFAITAPIVTLLLAQTAELSRYQWSAVIGAVAVAFAITSISLHRFEFRQFSLTHVTVSALLGSIAISLALDGDVLMISVPLQATALWLIGRRLDHKPMIWQSHVLYVITMFALIVRAGFMAWEGEFETLSIITDVAALLLLVWRSTLKDQAAPWLAPAVHFTAAVYLIGPLDEWALLLGLVILAGITRLAAHADIGNFSISTLVNHVVIVLAAVSVAASQYETTYELEWVPVVGLAVVSLAAFARLLPGRFSDQEAGLAYVGLIALVVVVVGSNDAAITAAWTAIGLATLAAGVRLEKSIVQKAGWATLAIAATKLMLHDLESTEALIRIALFFGIGLAFLGLAYLLPTHLAPQPHEDDELPRIDV